MEIKKPRWKIAAFIVWMLVLIFVVEIIRGMTDEPLAWYIGYPLVIIGGIIAWLTLPTPTITLEQQQKEYIQDAKDRESVETKQNRVTNKFEELKKITATTNNKIEQLNTAIEEAKTQRIQADLIKKYDTISQKEKDKKEAEALAAEQKVKELTQDVSKLSQQHTKMKEELKELERDLAWAKKRDKENQITARDMNRWSSLGYGPSLL